MANNFMVNVKPDFDLEAFAKKLTDTYQAKGFSVNTVSVNNMQTITLDKNTGGINMLLGMGLGIKATCFVNNNTLSINYSDGDWTGKIIGFVAGWFLCLIPFITAIIGTVNQLSLPKKINDDASMIVSGM